MVSNSDDKGPSIKVKSLSYSFPDGSSGLHDITLDLPAGSRTLLIGGMIGWADIVDHTLIVLSEWGW